MKKFVYTNEKAREIAFPLGGIGSGSISLAGDGRLVDFEISNKPNKKSNNGFSFFAVKAEKDGKFIDARALNSDPQFTFTGFETAPEDFTGFNSYGFGPERSTLCGIPHFPNSTFSASFPFAEIDFEYEKFPAKIHMSAFNPFIVGNDTDSSIPAAFFEFEIENTTKDTIIYTLCGSLNNPYEESVNIFGYNKNTAEKYITLTTGNKNISKTKYGELCISTNELEISYEEYWFRGNWFDNLQTFWNDFTLKPFFSNRTYNTSGKNDVASLSAHCELKGGEKKKIRFVISWYSPYAHEYLNPIPKEETETDEQYLDKNSWKNYYTTFFASAHDCAEYCLNQWDRLVNETNLFREALFTSTLPDEILDAVSGNLSILKSTTCLRLQDGSFYGFEGCRMRYGCCDGTCTHVWNYAYAIPFLFPKLERGIRENDYKYNQDIYGSMCFRMPLPLGREPSNHFPCLDGQMGGILKCYREFKICGNLNWLIELWPNISKSLDFAFSKDNPFKWDLNKDGVLEGRQHHTLDVELFGPSSWLCGMYLAALKAGSEMAGVIGDKRRKKEYYELFLKGKEWVDKNLFNGKYYYQKIDLTDKNLLCGYYLDGQENTDENVISYYWNEETGEIKYQIGEGSSVDQVLAQWHADILGLGEIFDKEQTKIALKSIYDFNFKSMRDFFNPCRLYCLNDEKGVVICAYPEGAKKPKITPPYAEECMNGFEYQVASHMIFEGLVDEGLEIVRELRKRYDGEKRNPFAEMECGSSYARSLASYSLLNAACGFEFDMFKNFIGFSPIMRFADKSNTFKCFFALDGGYGFVEQGPDYIEVKMLSGELKLNILNALGNLYAFITAAEFVNTK